MKYWITFGLLATLISGTWLFHEGYKHREVIESLCSGAIGLTKEQLAARVKEYAESGIIYTSTEASETNAETALIRLSSTTSCTLTFSNNKVNSYGLDISDPKKEWNFEWNSNSKQ